MTPSELQAIIGRQITQATGNLSDDISSDRGDMFDRYMGEPYGNEVEGRSKVVMTDIADTVEWIMPELMEVFTSGDEVVEFEPLGPDDEERAAQETDVVNHVFWRMNEGFLVLYSFIKDGLIQKNGYVKRWWDEREETRVEAYEGLAPEQLVELEGQWAAEGSKVDYIERGQEPAAEIEGVPAVMGSVSVKVRLTSKTEKLVVAPVPPDELILFPRWNSVFLDKCPFVAHRPKNVTVSSLIEQGYERKQVEGLPTRDDGEDSEEREKRFSARGSTENTADAADDTMREVLLHECFVYVDFDGDGVAELRRVVVGGPQYEVLRYKDGGEANEEVASNPFSAWTPIIIPHRHTGRSVAELIDDLQEIKTMLTRNMLDNVYLTNNPTRELPEAAIGDYTIEDLLTERPGKIVRTAEPGLYTEHAPAPFMQQILPAIEYVDQVREARSGASAFAQGGLDTNALNKNTPVGTVQQAMTAAQKKIKMIARICAETGVRDLFRGIHGDLRRNASKAMTIRLRGKWVDVDPRHWRNRADLEVNVGLGTGNNEMVFGKLMLLADRQQSLMELGVPVVQPANLYATLKRATEKAGFKNADAFWTDPAEIPQQEPKPDPQMALVQGQLEIERGKAQAKAEADMQAQGLEERKALLEDDRERDKANMDWALRLVEIKAKYGAQVTMAEIKADAMQASAANKPGPNA